MVPSTGMDDGHRHCPNDHVKNCGEGEVGFSLGLIPWYVGILSTFSSCVAAVVLVAVYNYKARRTREYGTALGIVTFIATADFFIAAAYLAENVSVLSSFNQTDPLKCDIFYNTYEITIFVMTCAKMSSFFWTMTLAFHLFAKASRSRVYNSYKLMPFYHIVGWGVPVVIGFLLLYFGKLGYAPFIGAVWCYLEAPKDHDSHHLPAAVVVKLPEITGYILIFILFAATRLYIYRQARAAGQTPTPKTAQLHRILGLIPAVFVFFQMWDTIVFFFCIYLSKKHTNEVCIKVSLRNFYIILGTLQAIGGGGQGWANTVIYICLPSRICQCLFKSSCCPKRSVQEKPLTTVTSPNPEPPTPTTTGDFVTAQENNSSECKDTHAKTRTVT